MAEYIYVMLRSDGLRKLGYAMNVVRRRTDLKAATGLKHTIEHIWAVPARAHAIEGCAHYELKRLKIKGHSSIELYDLPLERLVETVERAIEHIAGVYKC